MVRRWLKALRERVKAPSLVRFMAQAPPTKVIALEALAKVRLWAAHLAPLHRLLSKASRAGVRAKT